MIVTMPDGTNVEFPDDMPRDEIKGMIEKKFPKQVADFQSQSPEAREIIKTYKRNQLDVTKLNVNNVMSDDGLNSQPSSKIDMMLGLARMITPKDSYAGKILRAEDIAIRAVENTEWDKLAKEGAKSAGRQTSSLLVGGTGFMIKMAGDMFYPEYDSSRYEGDSLLAKVRKFKDDSNRAVFGTIRDFGQKIEDLSEKVNSSEWLKADEKLFAGGWEDNPNLHKAVDLAMSGVSSLVGMYVLSRVSNPYVALTMFSGIDAKDLYEEAREKGVSKGKAFGTWTVGTAGTAVLEKFGFEKVFGAKMGASGIRKVVDASKKTSSKIAKAFLAEGSEEGLQTFWQNLVAKVGYDESRDLFQNVIESFIGGALGGGLVSSFNYGYEAFKSKANKAGLTEQEQDNLVSLTAQAIANHPELVDSPLQENMRKNYASFQQMIEEMGDTPEAERLKETKKQLDEVYNRTFEQLKDKMPEKQAKAVSDIARSSALFFSDLEGMSVGEWFEKNAPQIKKVDSIENEIRQFAKNIEPIKTRLDLEDINLFEALKNPDIVKRYREKDTRSSLLQFIKKRGGAVDSGGELKAMDIGKNVIGAINNKSGESLDDLALAAWENGYFPEKTERPTVNELLEAIRDESFGKKRYAEEKQADLEDMVADLSEALDRMNIDYQNMTAREIEQAYNDYLVDMEERSAMNAEYADEASRAEDIFALYQESMDIAEENARLDDIYPAYEGETITINGQEKTVYNSNGDRIAKSKEALENFYKWFGDSKVVDEQGRPLVVYHGTNAEFSVFDKSKQKGSSYYGKGFYFTNWSDVSTYGKIKMPLYLNIKNPLIIKEGDISSLKAAEDIIGVHPDMPDEQKEWDFEGWAKYTLGYRSDIEGNIESVLSSKGYDGVIILDTENDGQRNKYIAFDSNQIKSTSNRGTYSESDNIYYQETSGPITESENFKKWSKNAPFYPASEAETHHFKTGEPLVAEVFHGTKRADRVGSVFLPERATSGPMAYSTDNKEIASNYAKGKQDTSLLDEMWGDYNKWFSIKVGDESYTLDKIWNKLDYKTMLKVRENAPHITTDDEGEKIIYDKNAKNGNGGYQPRSQYNNAIADLVDAWLISGSLYGREEQFFDVLELAGISRDSITYIDPYAEHEKVYELYVEMQKPLVTDDIPEDVIQAIEEQAKKEPVPPQNAIGVDPWDKRTQNPIEWAERLRTGESYLWTVIPDWATDVFKRFGYDGIVDRGGKGGGMGHNVFIPFSSSQYKSVENRGTFDINNPNIYYQSAFAGSRVDYDRPSLEAIGSGEGALGAYVNRIIYLSKNANASTLPHELFHFWSDMLRSSKSLRAKEILREVDKWANKEFDRKYSTIKTENGYAVVDKSGKTIYDRMGEGFATEEQARAYAKEELFARGGEKYLSEGKAPSKTLRQAFANFYNWLKKIYSDMMSLDIKLSKPMRDVYATILGGTSIDTFLDSDIDEFIEKRAEAEREKDMEVREIIQQAQGVKPVTLPEKIRKAYEEFDFGETWKKIMIPLSTRAKRVAPTLRNKIRRYEFDVLETKQAYYREIEPMLKKWKEFSKEDNIAFDLALKNGAIDIRDEILRKYNAVDDFAKVTEALEDIYYKANDAGLEVGYIEDYFPRKVKDKDGLLSYLHGTDEWSGFQEALHREDPHGQFSAEEQAEFIDKYLRGIVRADLAAYKYSSEKARKLDTIDNVLNQYYADSMQALIAYIDGMNARISTVNFFGRNRENVDESIGEFVAYLLNNNEIKPSQVDEVKSILNAVFKRRGVGSKWIKAGRDMSYIYTMGGVNTAITQLDDIFVAAYKGGVINTFSAAFQKDRVTKKDLGLDSIAAEFVEGSGVSKAVNWVFKHNGIELIDGFGKNALLNGVLKKMEQMSDADLRKYLEPVMEEETEQTMRDIRNGELSANVRFFLFNELSDMQPVSLSELPELYNVGGNARIFYMLKSFMLKRIDTLRNEVYDKMRSSDQATRIEGWKNMYRLILLMMIGGATKDLIIDLMYNRAIDLNDTVVNNLLGMVGISKYNIYQVREEGMGHTLAIFATPPLFSVAEDLSGDVNKYISGKREFKDFEVFKGLPIIGRFYYWLYGGGKTKTEKKKKKQR